VEDLGVRKKRLARGDAGGAQTGSVDDDAFNQLVEPGVEVGEPEIGCCVFAVGDDL
jgi:hypothetical protein